jgi:hypothetical protein
MSIENFQELIAEGIKGLPSEALAEIADFIYFVRKRVMQPQVYEQELQTVLLGLELKRLNQEEEAHLEREFEGYDKLYPRE